MKKMRTNTRKYNQLPVHNAEWLGANPSSVMQPVAVTSPHGTKQFKPYGIGIGLTLYWLYSNKGGERLKISYSRASSYLSCPYKHYLGYVKKLKSNKPARPLSFGSDFHKLLEFRNHKKKLNKAYHEIKEKYYEMPPKFQYELGDSYLDDLLTIFRDYRQVWKNAEQPIETEHEFLLLIGKIDGEPIYFHGVIDEIYEEPIVGEHKTFNQAPDMGTLAMNTQVCLYSKVMEIETGRKIERVRWDYIKSSPAKYPIWLETSQTFSKAKNSNITNLSWLRACKERGIEDEDVLKVAEQYRYNIANFFFKCDIEIIPQMIDTVWNDFRSVCADIAKRGDKNKVKNISRDCNWCNYRPICYGEFTGADVDYIIETDFEYRDSEDTIDDILQRIHG